MRVNDVPGGPNAGCDPLDNPVWFSLNGAHSGLAQRLCCASRYPGDVSIYVAFERTPVERDWRELAELSSPGAMVSVVDLRVAPPEGWNTLLQVTGVQMVSAPTAGTRSGELGGDLLTLGPEDVPDMISLADRTKPGPFLSRTIELGTYLGIRRGGRLVAMAGERLHPLGWTEISAVCTDKAWRCQGLATRLVRALEAGIRVRGEMAFLHVPVSKRGTIHFYEALGFRVRRTMRFTTLRVPN